MILSSQNVAPFLLDCGLIQPETIVDGGLTVVAVPRRNLNFKVFCGEGGFFVKQIRVWDPQISAEMQREALCYWAAQHVRAFAPLGEVAPRFAHYNPTRCILVTELLPNSESVSELYRRTEALPVDVTAALGRTIAGYHRLNTNLVQRDEVGARLPRRVPWIFSLHHVPGPFTTMSAANAQLVDVLHQYPEFPQALDELRTRWHVDGIIHGDLKWDNCVVELSPPSETGFRLRLVDWELMDLGDTSWDIAGVFSAFLATWVQSPSNDSLDRIRPALRAFWTAYRAAMEFSPASAAERLERCTRYAAVRLIQTGFEYMQRATELAASARNLLQVSVNMLREPRVAMRDLLAL